MTDGSPWRCGTGTGGTSARGFSRPARLYARRLLAFTSSVYFASCAASGTSMIDTEPRWSCELRPLASGRGVLSADFCQLREPWPLTLATKSFLPSGETRTAPGYQPVGISPSSLLSTGRSFRVEQDLAPRRTTAMQLLVPLAT